ncbi:MAG: OmpH family outer membrane protein [Flavobacteriaceae bacterium]|nr:OmpH family outer membrane protein [Flavobacteriaceae bacterium]
MKQIKFLVVVTVLFLSFGANAQVKLGHIDREALIVSMPETKAMQAELKKLSQTYDTEYKIQQNALQAKYLKYGKEQESKTEAENALRQKEVQDLQRKLQLYAQTADKELQQKRADLLNPIVKKAKLAIEDVAKAKGIKYVFDATPGSGLLVFKGTDLLPAVKTKLGIK